MKNSCLALLDSGAEGSLLDITTAAQWGISAVPLPSPISVWSFNGCIITFITHSTPPVSLVGSGNHHEVTMLYLLDSPSAPVVLGHPWLVNHGPHINWFGNSVLAWSQLCLVSCMCTAVSGSVYPVLQVETAVLTGLPAEYHNFHCISSLLSLMSLPPH